MAGYIYLLQEREFIKTGEKIYKIGKSTQTNCRRLSSYPKDSKLIYCSEVQDCHKSEKNIISKFRDEFIQKKDIGAEYFEGCYKKMKKIIFELETDIVVSNIDEDDISAIWNDGDDDDKNIKNDYKICKIDDAIFILNVFEPDCIDNDEYKYYIFKDLYINNFIHQNNIKNIFTDKTLINNIIKKKNNIDIDNFNEQFADELLLSYHNIKNDEFMDYIDYPDKINNYPLAYSIHKCDCNNDNDNYCIMCKMKKTPYTCELNEEMSLFNLLECQYTINKKICMCDVEFKGYERKKCFKSYMYGIDDILYDINILKYGKKYYFLGHIMKYFPYQYTVNTSTNKIFFVNREHKPLGIHTDKDIYNTNQQFDKDKEKKIRNKFEGSRSYHMDEKEDGSNRTKVHKTEWKWAFTQSNEYKHRLERLLSKYTCVNDIIPLTRLKQILNIS